MLCRTHKKLTVAWNNNGKEWAVELYDENKAATEAAAVEALTTTALEYKMQLEMENFVVENRKGNLTFVLFYLIISMSR